MANETKITQVVAKSAAKQVVELNSKLQELKRIYTDTAKSIGEGLKINPEIFLSLILCLNCIMKM